MVTDSRVANSGSHLRIRDLILFSFRPGLVHSFIHVHFRLCDPGYFIKRRHRRLGTVKETAKIGCLGSLDKAEGG